LIVSVPSRINIDCFCANLETDSIGDVKKDDAKIHRVPFPLLFFSRPPAPPFLVPTSGNASVEKQQFVNAAAVTKHKTGPGAKSKIVPPKKEVDSASDTAFVLSKNGMKKK
jgi:hypothetical protein